MLHLERFSQAPRYLALLAAAWLGFTAAPAAADGAKVYQSVCAVCHTSGVAGAPNEGLGCRSAVDAVGAVDSGAPAPSVQAHQTPTHRAPWDMVCPASAPSPQSGS